METERVGSSTEEIKDAIIEFLGTQVLVEGVDLQPDTSLSEIGVDSFSLMEIILFLERKFGLVIPLEELTPETISSVTSLAASCSRLMGSDPK